MYKQYNYLGGIFFDFKIILRPSIDRLCTVKMTVKGRDKKGQKKDLIFTKERTDAGKEEFISRARINTAPSMERHIRKQRRSFVGSRSKKSGADVFLI